MNRLGMYIGLGSMLGSVALLISLGYLSFSGTPAALFVHAGFVCASIACLLVISQKHQALVKQHIPHYAFISVGSISSLILVFSYKGLFNSLSPVYQSVIASGACLLSSFGLGWLMLCYLEWISTKGAPKALQDIGICAFGAAGVFVILHVLTDYYFALPLLIISSALLARPEPYTRFFYTNAQERTGVRESFVSLCKNILEDWSPRLLLILALISGIGVAGICMLFAPAFFFQHLDSGQNTLTFVNSANLEVCLLLCIGISAFISRGISQHTEAAIGVILALLALGMIYISHQNAQVLLSLDALGATSGIQTLIQMGALIIMCCVSCMLIWVIMIERALMRKLPMIGLFASLISAQHVGMGVIFFGIWGEFHIFLPKSIGDMNFSAIMFHIDSQNIVMYLGLLILGSALLLTTLHGQFILTTAAATSPIDLNSYSTTFNSQAQQLASMINLTPREREIFELWILGRPSPYIEKRLGISKNTVKTHLNHIYQKAQVSTKEELLNKIEKLDM